MDAEAPDGETLRSILDLIAGAWRVRLLDTRWLPDIAAELIVAGVDSPSVVELAGLDLAPFDPRDASDLLVAVFDELELAMPNLGDALMTATVLVASAVHGGRLSPRYATQWASRTFMAADYPDEPPELVDLFNLNEQYDAADYGYGHRSAEEIDSDVRNVSQGLFTDRKSYRWAVDPFATRIVELILPSL